LAIRRERNDRGKFSSAIGTEYVARDDMAVEQRNRYVLLDQDRAIGDDAWRCRNIRAFHGLVPLEAGLVLDLQRQQDADDAVVPRHGKHDLQRLLGVEEAA